MINGELIVDNFAGGGGASTGIELATETGDGIGAHILGYDFCIFPKESIDSFGNILFNL